VGWDLLPVALDYLRLGSAFYKPPAILTWQDPHCRFPFFCLPATQQLDPTPHRMQHTDMPGLPAPATSQLPGSHTPHSRDMPAPFAMPPLRHCFIPLPRPARGSCTPFMDHYTHTMPARIYYICLCSRYCCLYTLPLLPGLLRFILLCLLPSFLPLAVPSEQHTYHHVTYIPTFVATPCTLAYLDTIPLPCLPCYGHLRVPPPYIGLRVLPLPSTYGTLTTYRHHSLTTFYMLLPSTTFGCYLQRQLTCLPATTAPHPTPYHLYLVPIYYLARYRFPHGLCCLLTYAAPPPIPSCPYPAGGTCLRAGPFTPHHPPWHCPHTLFRHGFRPTTTYAGRPHLRFPTTRYRFGFDTRPACPAPPYADTWLPAAHHHRTPSFNLRFIYRFPIPTTPPFGRLPPPCAFAHLVPHHHIPYRFAFALPGLPAAPPPVGIHSLPHYHGPHLRTTYEHTPPCPCLVRLPRRTTFLYLRVLPGCWTGWPFTVSHL